jgi:putative ABC transport system permease protein
MSRAARRLRAAWSGLTGTGAAASIALALLVLACTFVAVALPRASLRSQTRAVQQLFASTGALGRTVTGTQSLASFAGGSGASDLSTDYESMAEYLRAAGLTTGPRSAGWSGITTQPGPVAGTKVPGAQLELAYRDTLPQNARIVTGSMPARATITKKFTLLQIAVTQPVARTLGLAAGSELLEGGGSIRLLVTGIIAPVRARSAFWTFDPTLAATQVDYSGAFIGAAELPALEGFADPSITNAVWGLPLSLTAVNAMQVPGLRASLVSALARIEAGPLSGIIVGSPLIGQLSAFMAAEEDVANVLALLFVSLTAIGLIVVLLGVRLLTEARRAEFSLLQARGAAVRQLAWLALRGGSLVAIPAAALAVAAATALTPGATPLLEWPLAAVTLAAALAGPPVMTLRGRRARRGRAGLLAGGPSPRVLAMRRAVLDITLAGAAAGGLLELRQLGSPAAGGLNYFTSAAPLLVAIPAAIIVMRLYPVALRWTLRLTGRRRGVTAFVGLARGSRTALSSALPVFALVLALALVAFGTTLRSAIDRGDVLASWQAVGADAVVTGPSGAALTPSQQRAFAAVPGVRHIAAEVLTTGSSGPDFSIAVLEVSPAQYSGLVAGTQAPAFPAALLRRPASGAPSAVPVLVSPGASQLLAGATGELSASGRTLNVRTAGTVTSMAGEPAGSTFVVVPSWAVPPGPANVLAVTGPHLDDAALAAAVRRAGLPAASLRLRSAVLRALAAAPLPHGGYLAFAQGAAAAALFSALILLLSMILGARSRELTLARLATMGLSRGQARRLAIIETVPAVVAATAGGIACALALVPLLAPSISLAAFTGSAASVPVRADPAALAGTAAALLVLALATITVQAALASRRGAARALRVGE